MLRKFACGLVALLLCVGILMADEVKGKVKSVDTEKNTITITVGEKDVTYNLTDGTEVVTAAGKAPKDKAKALKGLKADAEVVLTVEKKDGKETVTKLQLPAGKKKDKK